MQVINTNIMSLMVQNNLSNSQSGLSSAMERLSSGLRINSAKDDAAGLAIATRMTTQINGLNQSVRNANDGVSLSQTAEGALKEVTSNLQRIRELAVESANATNSSADRSALDQEVQQRIAEINRIASQTTFNGLHVLDGTFGTANFQVGADVGNTIQVNLSQGVKSTQIGSIATVTGSAVTSSTMSTLTVALGSGASTSIGSSASFVGSDAYHGADSAYAKAAAINASNIAGLTTTATNTYSVALTAVTGAAATTYSLSINGVSIISGADANAGVSTATIAAAVASRAGDTNVSSVYNSATGTITLTAADGANINIDESGSTTAVTASGFGTAGGAAVDHRGTVTLNANQSIVVGGGAATGAAAAGLSVTTTALGAQTLGNSSVTTVSNANTAILRVDAALTSVSALRSTLGAIQNRFESTVMNLQSVAQNLTQSRSRIQDADFAAETASMSRSQILQQAGTAVLAQANISPQSVLKLLQ